jgi:sulfite exporter TauE/SafE
MEARTIAGSFILGLTFGWGPCLASCGPLFLVYVSGTGKNPIKGVGAYLLFSVSRVLVYLILGLLVFYFGRLVFERYSAFFKFILVGSGIFIMMLGALICLGKEIKLSSCSFLYKYILEKDKKSIIALGLAAGFLPCAPLVTLLAYTGLASRSIFDNLAYTASFGFGTAISPLIIFAALAGLIPKLFRDGSQSNLKVSPKKGHFSFVLRTVPKKLFNIICGLIIIIMGLQLIRRIF